MLLYGKLLSGPSNILACWVGYRGGFCKLLCNNLRKWHHIEQALMISPLFLCGWIWIVNPFPS